MYCPFCDIKEKFSSIYLEGVGKPKEKHKGAWIDYEEDKHGNILWYAILNGDQFVRGHTLVISGLHIVKITGNVISKSLKSIILGLNRVSKKLKEKLDCESVHVLTLCEGQEHLHFHLIPRYYEYSNNEITFFVNQYWKRDKKLFNQETKKKEYENEEDFKSRIAEGTRLIHGMWYAGYREMNYRFINPNNPNEIEKRINELKELTDLLRDPDLKEPTFLSILVHFYL